MSFEYLIGLFILASSLAWTPGPNNALLAASGARYGYIATLPHIVGVTFGFALMQFIIWMGVGELFEQFPVVRTGLKFIGGGVMLWLAFKLATAKFSGVGGVETGKPWGVFRAAAFQWVNPKAWVMVIGLTSIIPEDIQPTWFAILIVTIVFWSAGMMSTNGWTLFGKSLQRLLNSPLRFRVFNLVMAGLLVLTVVGIMASDF